MSKTTKSEWEPVRQQLDPQHLDSTLGLLQKHYQFIDFDTAISIIRGTHPPIPNAMAITLDDGYANNLSHGLPIFKQYNVRPMLYIATGHVEHQHCFWFDRLDYALQQVAENAIAVPFDNGLYQFNTYSRESVKQSYAAFRKTCEYYFPDDESMQLTLASMAFFIENKTGYALSGLKNDPWSRLATWEELTKAVAQNELDVGSHTVNHVRVSRAPEKEAISELQGSKQKVEEMLNRNCDHFCYPNGDYNQETEQQLKKLGYQTAVTVEKGINNTGDNLFQLKRLSFPEQQGIANILYRLVCRY